MSMKRRTNRSVVATALAVACVVVLALSGCVSSSSNQQESSSHTPSSTHSTSTQTQQAESTSEEPTAEAAPGPEPESQPAEPVAPTPPAGLAEGRPYKGLSEEFIDMTGLGPHDVAESVHMSNNNYRGTATAYRWYSRNGKHELLFTANCAEGYVVQVSVFRQQTNYWPTFGGLPDFYASGEPNQPTEPFLEDPLDYDSPEEYADNAEDWFAYHGYDDPWYAAYQHWEDEAA